MKLVDVPATSKPAEAPVMTSRLVEVPASPPYAVKKAVPPTRADEMVTSAARHAPRIEVLPNGTRIRFDAPEVKRDSMAPAQSTALPFASEKWVPARIAPTDTPAVALPNQPPPIYPNQLRAANIEGKVIARFMVKVDGTTDGSTIVIEKSDHDLFTKSVMEAIPLLRFSPAIKGGRPVASEVTMPFVFSLSR